ncbi:hypothetical protein JCM18237_28230 [Halorubrum luteum]
MGPERDGSDFTRRKFTIPRRLDEELVRVAEDHYQGNVSLCIRAAFEDHKQTLNGEGEIAFGRLLSHVDEMAKRQSEILNRIESLEDDVGGQGTPNPSSEGPFDPRVEQVYRELEQSDGGLRIDDLRERLDLNLPAIQSALGKLVDHGLSTDRATDSERFWAVGVNELPQGGCDE